MGRIGGCIGLHTRAYMRLGNALKYLNVLKYLCEPCMASMLFEVGAVPSLCSNGNTPRWYGTHYQLLLCVEVQCSCKYSRVIVCEESSESLQCCSFFIRIALRTLLSLLCLRLEINNEIKKIITKKMLIT